jgi:hypothetical protein
MLSKTVCKKCHRTNKSVWDYVDEEAWHNNYVFCPSEVSKNNWSWYNRRGRLQQSCPYELEHVVNAK